MDMDRQRRAELVGWITETRRLQRRLATIYAVLGVLAVTLAWWRGAVGVLVLALVGVVAASSFWVTAGHTAGHRNKLDELARLDRAKAEPLATAHRRWMRSA